MDILELYAVGGCDRSVAVVMPMTVIVSVF